MSFILAENVGRKGGKKKVDMEALTISYIWYLSFGAVALALHDIYHKRGTVQYASKDFIANRYTFQAFTSVASSFLL